MRYPGCTWSRCRPSRRETDSRTAQLQALCWLSGVCSRSGHESAGFLPIPSSTEDWLRVQQWITLQEKVLTFEIRWNELHQFLSVPALEGSVAGLRQLELTATVARKAHRLSTHFDDELSKGVRKGFEQNGVVSAN